MGDYRNNNGLNISELLEAAMPVGLRHVTHRIRDVANDQDVRVALSGGIPRDLVRIQTGQLTREEFLNNIRDFDVLVEGNGVRFAKALAARLPGDLTVNEAFHTATLKTNDPVHIDITSARIEEYPRPGQLPVVDISGVTLEQDMLRRDFTVNAMAVLLSPDFGRLIDPTGGVGDIRDGLIRALHTKSFSDDPTRLMRALRYSLRLKYDMEPTTRIQFTNAVEEAVTDHLTPERIRYELECIGSEERWAEIWAVMDLSGLAKSLVAPLGSVSRTWELEQSNSLDIGISNKRDMLAEEELDPWVVRTTWALLNVSKDILGPVVERLGLYKRQAGAILSAREVIAVVVRSLTVDRSPSQVVRLLEQFPRLAVALALFTFQPATQGGVLAKRQMLKYLEEYSHVRSELNGHDLMDLGLSPGRELGRIRDELRYMRLDGVINDIDTEREEARKLIGTTAVMTDEPPPLNGNGNGKE